MIDSNFDWDQRSTIGESNFTNRVNRTSSFNESYDTNNNFRLESNFQPQNEHINNDGNSLEMQVMQEDSSFFRDENDYYDRENILNNLRSNSLDETYFIQTDEQDQALGRRASEEIDLRQTTNVQEFGLDELNANDCSFNISTSNHPTLEKIQRVYYTRGLKELENLDLLDFSFSANWKLSSFKQGYGLEQLRDDSPDTYWQSNGNNGSNVNNNSSDTQLTNPHHVTIQFSKKVSLERISFFTNFSLDESYTPSKIKIMAGSSDAWDLCEVCTVNFSKPTGWSHIIFNGIRPDGVLKCFLVRLIILSNHQDGKDSHIRAIRCFGKKTTNVSNLKSSRSSISDNQSLKFVQNKNEILQDMSLTSKLSIMSDLLLNNKNPQFLNTKNFITCSDDDESNDLKSFTNTLQDQKVFKIVENVSNVINFNNGFQSVELKSVSKIR